MGLSERRGTVNMQKENYQKRLKLKLPTTDRYYEQEEGQEGEHKKGSPTITTTMSQETIMTIKVVREQTKTISMNRITMGMIRMKPYIKTKTKMNLCINKKITINNKDKEKRENNKNAKEVDKNNKKGQPKELNKINKYNRTERKSK